MTWQFFALLGSTHVKAACKKVDEIKPSFHLFPMFEETWSQFHQHSTSSFYACRSQRRKKDSQVKLLFALLGSARVKAARRMLVKLTPEDSHKPTFAMKKTWEIIINLTKLQKSLLRSICHKVPSVSVQNGDTHGRTFFVIVKKFEKNIILLEH